MYLKEISAMMHSFGDVKEPREKSVQLMQDIVHDQMNLLLLEAEKVACIHLSPEISHKEILFLMRKNKMKLKHLVEYLFVLDMKQTYNKDLSDENIADGHFDSHGKRVEKCLKFMESIEDCNDITSVMKDKTIMDITSIKRKMRRFWATLKMSVEEYEEFSKTSQASFCPLYKFKRWLLKDNVICIGLTDFAVRIIDFLARETVAEIVDMVLIMKMKKLGKYQPLYFENYLIQSVSNLETSNDSVQTNGKDNHERDCSASSTSNNVSSPYDQRLRNQMSMNKRDKLKNSSHEGCKNDLNKLNSEKSGLLSFNLARTHLQHEHFLQKGRTECEMMCDESNCDLQCRTKLDDCHDVQPVKRDLNKETDFNHMQSGHLTASIPKPTIINQSSDVNRKIVISDLSDYCDFNDTYSPSNSNTFQGLPVAGTSYQSQKNSIDIQDISDTSDCENCPPETVTSCDHKKSFRRGISPSKHFRKIVQEESIIVNSAVANYLSIAAQNNHKTTNPQTEPNYPTTKTSRHSRYLQLPYQNTLYHEMGEIVRRQLEVKYITKPIEPIEIIEAFGRFQQPSPMVLIFANDHIPRKTKLICLAESSSSSII